MAKSAREQLAELEKGYKERKKALGKVVRVEEAKELSGLFDTTLNLAVEALRESVTAGLGIYHRNLKAVVVRVSVDAKNVTSIKNTIRTIRMTPAEIKVWDESHPEVSRSEKAELMGDAIADEQSALDMYLAETVRLEAEAEAEAEESQEPETETPVDEKEAQEREAREVALEAGVTS